MTASIKVEGLQEFQSSVAEMRVAAPKRIKLLEASAGQIIVTYAQRTMPRRTGKAVASVKARTSSRGTVVSEGGPSAPWAPWLDFGGQGRRKGRPAPRPFLKEGRYTYKGLRVHQDELTAAANETLVAIATDAGLEIS